MRIDLDRVRREPFHWQETREVPPASLERPELDGLSEVDWRGKVEYTDPGFYFQGRLAYEQTLVCTRCLSTFTVPVDEEVDLLLYVEKQEGAPTTPWWGAEAPGQEVELEEEDLGVLKLGDEIFDTDPVLEEQLQLNIPMKPVCDPECSGLCPACGADLNQGECSCDTSSVDQRWQALAGLKDQLADDD